MQMKKFIYLIEIQQEVIMYCDELSVKNSSRNSMEYNLKNVDYSNIILGDCIDLLDNIEPETVNFDEISKERRRHENFI